MTACIVVNVGPWSHNAQYRTCPSYFHVLQLVPVSSGLKHYFFQLSCMIITVPVYQLLQFYSGK